MVSGGESGEIALNPVGITTITIVVINNEVTIKYDLHINYYHFSGDIDKDGDGLIEINDWAGLNAIRYQADGTAYKKTSTSPKIMTGCPANGCIGYELTADLDLSAEDNWLPIDVFTGIFEGNSHTISNLKINRPDTNRVGLFGYIGRSSEINNIGLLSIDIEGNNSVGGLAGRNSGSITDSYTTGSVDGDWHVGGLVGRNGGSITNSYTTGSVIGDKYVGGLVGRKDSGSIINSYTTGSVDGNSYTGGLVGKNYLGSIANSYATGSVVGDYSGIGGLVGLNNSGGSIANSYWDTETSGISTSGGGTGKTTAELQEPTMATGIYSMWSTDDWDFGSASQYPVLKGENGNLLSPTLRYGLSRLRLSEGNLSPDFIASQPNYTGTVVSSASTIQLIPTAVNS